MASGQTLQQALFEAMAEAREAQEQMVPLGRDLAEAEREYRIAKRMRILWERTENKTAVTLIPDVVKGYDDIAALCYKRDEAEALYEANREALLLAKKRVDTIREMLAREWSANAGA